MFYVILQSFVFGRMTHNGSNNRSYFQKVSYTSRKKSHTNTHIHKFAREVYLDVTKGFLFFPSFVDLS